MRAACAGVGLIEVLVALLVLTVGGLGMLALQSQAVQNTQAAILQGNAVMLAHHEITLRYRWHHVAANPCATADQLASALRARGWRATLRNCGPRCPLVVP